MANEKRLIDANVLSGEVDKSKHNNPHPPGPVRVNHRNEHDHFLRMILDTPTVDAVEVVRCKDCKNGRQSWLEGQTMVKCMVGKTMLVTPEHFCSYGERKDNA